jgi:ABC-2 type transport system ATP-binding protein
MVNVLTTLTKADAGTAHVAGHDVAAETKAVRAEIGVTGQFAAVDDLLTGQENLQLMADLHHLRADEGKRVVTSLLERFDLAESAQKMAATYSGGMRRKLDLAMTLVTTPQIIFLDEPTTGLDPRSRRTMWNIIRGLVADGVTVFLTTQYLDEADHLAHRIAVLDQGHLVAEGTPDELKRQVAGSHVQLQFSDAAGLDAAARVLTGSTVDDAALILQVPSDGKAKSVRALLDQLDEHSIDVDEFSVHTPDLDDVFLALTGHASTEETAR